MWHELVFITMKNNQNISFLLAKLLFVLFNTNCLFAQTTIHKIWTGAEFRFNINDHFDIDYYQEVRADLNEKKHRYLYNDFAIGFTPNDAFRFSAAYRHRLKNATYRDEVHFNGSYSIDLRPIGFDIRLRLHRKYDDDDTRRDFLRTRLSISYRYDKNLRFAAQAETFNRIDENKKESLEKGRYGASVEYRFSRAVRMEVKYLFEDDMTLKKPKDAHIYSIGFDFRI